MTCEKLNVLMCWLMLKGSPTFHRKLLCISLLVFPGFAGLATVCKDPGRALQRRLIEAERTDFVNDEEPWLGKHFHGVGQSILSKAAPRRR